MAEERQQLTKEEAEMIAEQVLEKAIEHADQAIGRGLLGWVFKVVLMCLIFVLGVAASKGIKP